MNERQDMEGKPSDGLTIEYSPTGRNGKATLTAKLGGDVIAVESLDLTKPQARAGFVGAVCDGRPGIDAQALGDELLRMAAELANKPDAGGKKGKRTGIIHSKPAPAPATWPRQPSKC